MPPLSDDAVARAALAVAARSRALVRLADAHPGEYRKLLDQERARRGLPKSTPRPDRGARRSQ